MTINELLAQYRALIDAKDEIQERLSKVNGEIADTEAQLRAAMDAQGMNTPGDKVSGAGVTATLREKWKAKYDPERWESIVAWAVENDKTYLIQRRLTDAKVMELVDNGEPLPEGLTAEAFMDLEFRRK